MSKFLQRLWPCLLGLGLLLTTLPVLASDPIYWSDGSHSIHFWHHSGDSVDMDGIGGYGVEENSQHPEWFQGTITIPATVDGYRVTTVSSTRADIAGDVKDQITSIVFPSSVWKIKTIGSHPELTSVTLPSGLTSCDNLNGNPKLKQVNLPASLKCVPQMKNCGFTSFNVPSYAKRIADEAFSGCTQLTQLTIQEGVEWIGQDFILDTKVSSLVIPSTVKTWGYNIMTYTWSSRLPFGNPDAPDSILTNLEFRGGAIPLVYNLKALNSLVYPQSGESYGGISKCPLITELTIPEGVSVYRINFVGSAVAAVGYIDDMPGLKRINLPAVMNGDEKMNISRCTALEAVVAKSETPLRQIGWGNDNNYSNCILYVPSGCRNNYRSVWRAFKDVWEGTPGAAKTLFVDSYFTVQIGEAYYRYVVTQEEDLEHGKRWECRLETVYGKLPSVLRMFEEVEYNGYKLYVTAYNSNLFSGGFGEVYNEVLGKNMDVSLDGSNVTTISLGPNTHTLPDNLFYYVVDKWPNLKSVRVSSTTPEALPYYAFNYRHYYQLQLMVPLGMLPKYAEAEGWSRFSNLRSYSDKETEDFWEVWDRQHNRSNAFKWNSNKTGALYGNGSRPTTPLLETTITVPGTAGTDDTGEEITVTGLAPNAFNGEDSLVHVSLPPTVEEIGDSAFMDCTSLKALVMNDTLPPTVGKDAFKGVSDSAMLWVPMGSVKTYTDTKDFDDFSYIVGGEPNSYRGYSILGAYFTSLTDDGTEVCYYRTDGSYYTPYTSVRDYNGRNRLHVKGDLVLPVTVCGDTVMAIESSAFWGNQELTSVSLPEGLRSINYNAFSGCTGLERVELADSTASIGSNAFYGCTSLESIDLKNVRYLDGGAFNSCSALKTISLPATLPTVQSSTFAYCTSLESVDLNEVKEVGSGAFSECTSLKDINLSGIYYIGGNAFYGCTSLADTLRLDSIRSIYYGAFGNCTSLPGVVFGDSTKQINSRAFQGCTAIGQVTALMDEPIYLPEDVFEDTVYHAATLIVPQGTKPFYMLNIAGSWRKFEHFVEAEGDHTGLGEHQGNTSSPACYDLMGRLVTTPQRGQIYIINGRKVLIR